MKKTILILILSLSCVYGGSSSVLMKEKPVPGWNVGVAEAVITPDFSMWMGGYASRTHPSTGKIHDLWAKALMFEDSHGNKSLLITTDLEGFPKSISDDIRDELNNKIGLSRSQIIINSSHSHSGPAIFPEDINILLYNIKKEQQEKINEYAEWLSDCIVSLAIQAGQSMEPATIYSGNGIVRFQVNRRSNKEIELTSCTELKGPNDFAVPVLKVENKNGEIKAIIFGYACHATVLNGYNWCGDYPGFAQIELKKKYPGAVVMFFQGTAGDLNPLPRRTIPLAQQYGEELSYAVKCVLNENMQKLTPELQTSYSEIRLPYDVIPSKEEFEKLSETLSGYEKRWAEQMLEKIKKGEKMNSFYPYPISVWRLGGQLMIGLGGEPFVKYDIELKQLLGESIFVLGYCNDVMSYILPDSELTKGGYETTAYRCSGLPAPFVPGIEKIILDEVIKLSEKVGYRQKIKQ